MRLYIVRHGKAHEPSPGRAGSGGSDFDRELTARGQSQAAFLAERIAAVDPRPDVILASRYPRALKTARAIEGALQVALVVEAGLEVDEDVARALELIEREIAVGHRSIMLVGHNPQLGELIGVLASGLPPQEMILKTGELVALEVRPAQMIGSARIVGRLRLGAETSDETIVGGVFAVGSGGRMQLQPH
jgi:phosphohistidine phosphatase